MGFEGVLKSRKVHEKNAKSRKVHFLDPKCRKVHSLDPKRRKVHVLDPKNRILWFLGSKRTPRGSRGRPEPQNDRFFIKSLTPHPLNLHLAVAERSGCVLTVASCWPSALGRELGRAKFGRQYPKNLKSKLWVLKGFKGVLMGFKGALKGFERF